MRHQPSTYALRLENYIPLIAKIARSYYRNLPEGRKSWVQLDDLIHDAVVAVQVRLLPNYEHKKAKFTTILTIFVERYFINYTKAIRRMKRNEALNVPIDDIEYMFGSTETPRTINNRFAVNDLMNLYALASPALKLRMCYWFFDENGVHLKSLHSKDSNVRDEFLQLATRLGITSETCRAFFSEKLDGNYAAGYGSRIPQAGSVR